MAKSSLHFQSEKLISHGKSLPRGSDLISLSQVGRKYHFAINAIFSIYVGIGAQD